MMPRSERRSPRESYLFYPINQGLGQRLLSFFAIIFCYCAKLTDTISTIDDRKLSNQVAIHIASTFADFSGDLDVGAARDIGIRIEHDLYVALIGGLDEKGVACDLLDFAYNADGLTGVLGEHGGVDERRWLLHFEICCD